MTRQQLYADLPAELLEADDLLRRYGRWAKDRQRLHRCASAEGNYKAPANDDDRQPREVLMPAADVDRTRAALLKLPMMTLLVIQWLYVDSSGLSAKMRKNGIQPRHMRERHLEGVREFWGHWKQAQHCCNYQTVVKASNLIYDYAT